MVHRPAIARQGRGSHILDGCGRLVDLDQDRSRLPTRTTAYSSTRMALCRGPAQGQSCRKPARADRLPYGPTQLHANAIPGVVGSRSRVEYTPGCERPRQLRRPIAR
jgi:hypothetical protein